MKRLLFATAGIVGLLVGAAFIMPAVAKWHRYGPDGGDVMGPLVLGTLIGLASLSSLVKATLGHRA
jgi:hypothetical protein